MTVAPAPNPPVVLQSPLDEQQTDDVTQGPTVLSPALLCRPLPSNVSEGTIPPSTCHAFADHCAFARADPLPGIPFPSSLKLLLIPHSFNKYLLRAYRVPGTACLMPEIQW